MQPSVKAGVPGHVLARVNGIYPLVYIMYFRLHKKPKNFMSYGCILNALYEREGVTQHIGALPTLKTPSKLLQSHAGWSRIRNELGI
jgi:hypothetical protein